MAGRKYGDDAIKSITDDRDRVRKRPTLYIPSTNAKGALHIAFEIIDNSVDELMVKDAVGDTITVVYNTKTKEFTITDDGSGIPQNSLIDVCTIINSSGKFDNDENSAYQWSGGTNGIGLKLAVFMSDYCNVTSIRDGKALIAKFVDGRLTTTETNKVGKKEHGTIVSFRLMQKYVDINGVTEEEIITRCREKSLLFPKIHMNLVFVYEGRGGKKTQKEMTFYGKDITDGVMDMEPSTQVIHVEDDREVQVLKSISDETVPKIRVITEAAFALKDEALESEKDAYIISYCNTIKTYSGGTNVEGLKQGLVKYFNKNVIPNLGKRDQDLNILPSDITAGLCGIVVAKVYVPEFEGQHKDRVNNQEIRYAVRDAVCEALENAKPSIVNPMIDFVKRVTRGRMASKKVRKKDVTSAFSKTRNKKLQDMIWNAKTLYPELIVVEGDAAADAAASARDYNNQAIFGVMKPKNTIDDDSDKIDRNAVSTFNDILDYINVQPGKKCDPKDCRVSKILSMTDGDVDGYAITNTVISLLAKHCKPLVEAGMVGRILPPLYSFKSGKKTVYVRSRKEFFDAVMKNFVKNVTIGHEKTGDFSKKQLFDFLDLNFEYTDHLKKLQKRYYCDAKFLEYVASKYHGNLENQTVAYWSKAMKRFDDIKVRKEDKTIILDGNIGKDYIHLPIDQYFDHYVHRFKKYQEVNDYIEGYTINGKKGCTIFDVMSEFDEYKPDHLIRFKGLGELDPSELRPLCMDRKTREVLIYKFDDFEEDMYKINVIMSTKQKFTEIRSNILRNMVADDVDIDT